MRWLPASVLLVLSACATVPRVALTTPPRDEAALAAAAEAFYSSATPAELRAAVGAAQAAGPESAVFHELAWRLAQLEGRDAEAVAHLLAAQRDLAGDSTLLNLNLLEWQDFTQPTRAQVDAHLLALAAQHPSPEVRATAAYLLTGHLHAEGRLAERDRWLAAIPGRLSFSAVGTWDNDQGKGFDLELGPETRPGYGETYEGRVGPVRWRRDLPVDPRGRLDLAALMSPARWSIAYAQAEVVVPTAGTWALGLSTSDPLKVWVDGKLVFSAPQVDRTVFDQLLLPLALSAGPHRVLVKSAHRTGVWFLMGRLVPAEGGPLELSTVDAAVLARARALDPSRARTWALLAAWAHFMAGGAASVKVADGYARRFPKSLVARLWQADSLWFNQERGRTADLLQALDEAVGDDFPFVRLRQARFHAQQGLRQKARERVDAVLAAHPSMREAHDLRVEGYRAEGWIEDELEAERARIARLGPSPSDLLEYARTLVRDGRRAEALQVYGRLERWLPLQAELLDRLAELARDAGQLEAAAQVLERRLGSWPTDFGAWLELADVHRRAGDAAAAREALARAGALSPDASATPQRQGELWYREGQRTAALEAWRRALELSPENEALANRIDFLAPEQRGPWLDDVPDEAAIAAAVQRRAGLVRAAGADSAWLLDHEVTLLNSDGSTANVVTLVLHAYNSAGRDRIIRQSVPSGRLRVLRAYSVDEKGTRSEASGERSRQIFFRGLQPGSTVVLQYRLDVPPSGYLARNLTKAWTFQSPADQRLRGEFVIWMPAGTRLHEHLVGTLSRSEARRGEQVRLAWLAQDVAPLVSEPSMPPPSEVGLTLHVSSVPDWKTWLSFEQALLEGAFRDSPELDAVAKKLEEGAASAEEKLRRTHAFVMEEIRYQQDYESFIAGVKPHPAPMVLERRYGDCKDKAVLFIELSRKLGLAAHFALVRTRDAGPVLEEVPMQQFNHAIVYVPAQPGVPEGRFFDPTADLLDLDVLRADDVGTRSLVFDPQNGAQEWRTIPWQAPEANRDASWLKLALAPDGSAAGSAGAEAVGRAASVYRRLARNQEQLEQALQRVGAALVPGAVTAEVKVLETSLAKPAALSASLAAPTFARAEGEALRFKLPVDWSPRGLFALATRRHPLVLGVPARHDTSLELSVPDGFTVKQAPRSGGAELPCLSMKREVRVQGRSVKATTSFVTRCERIAPQEYPQYRALAEEMARLLEEELVVAPERKRGPATPQR